MAGATLHPGSGRSPTAAPPTGSWRLPSAGARASLETPGRSWDARRRRPRHSPFSGAPWERTAGPAGGGGGRRRRAGRQLQNRGRHQAPPSLPPRCAPLTLARRWLLGTLASCRSRPQPGMREGSRVGFRLKGIPLHPRRRAGHPATREAAAGGRPRARAESCSPGTAGPRGGPLGATGAQRRGSHRPGRTLS